MWTSSLQPLLRGARRLRPTTRASSSSSSSDMREVSIGIIGAGKMAEAMTDGLKLKDRLPRSGKLHVFDTHPERCQLFASSFDAVVHPSAVACAKESDVLLLAVKPQNLRRLGKAIRGQLRDNTVVLSIMAGITQDMLASTLECDRVVRSMPNTPAAVQQGITVWCCTDEVDDTQREICASMLGAFGEEVFVEEEHYLDMATAVSGSGPAYIFLVMEAMIETGVHFGFSRNIATKLVHHTIHGAAVYAMQSNMNTASLRANITSPGGTTASALYTLERGNLRTTIADGLWAAYRRSLELGQQDPNVGPDRNKIK